MIKKIVFGVPNRHIGFDKITDRGVGSIPGPVASDDDELAKHRETVSDYAVHHTCRTYVNIPYT